MNEIKTINRDTKTAQESEKLKNAFDLYSKLKGTIYDTLSQGGDKHVLDCMICVYTDFGEYRKHKDVAYLNKTIESSKSLIAIFGSDAKNNKNMELARLFSSITINAQEFIVEENTKDKNNYKTILLLREIRDNIEKFGVEPFMHNVKDRIKHKLLALEFGRQ